MKTNKNKFINEIIFMLLFLNIINLILAPANPGFIHLFFNPFWFVILLISSRYGFFPGLMSSVIVTLNLLIWQLDFNDLSKGEIDKIIEGQNIIIPIFFILVSMMLGIIRQKYIEKEKEIALALNTVSSQNNSLVKEVKDAKVIIDELEKRIIGSKDFFSIFQEIHKLARIKDPIDMKKNLLSFLSNFYEVEKACIYSITSSPYKILANIGENNILSFQKDTHLVLLEKKEYLIYNCLEKNNLALFPIYNHSGKLTEILEIEKMSFKKFTNINLNTINLIIKVVNLL
ncbi:MAG: hypothetical protein GY830_08650 [Bacteroidetes bacterium]|nr:hypothetical protein [Bacteroidota bacterium]